MRSGFLGRLALAVCLLCLSTDPAGSETRPIEGHENWKLGMSMAEALAAEPRARRHDCAGTDCLHYADRRFASAEIGVSARFSAAGQLDVIVVSMAVQPGDNLCLRLSAQLAAFYTAVHGDTLPVSGESWIWTSEDASLTLLKRCRIGETGTIDILFEAVGQRAEPDKS